MVRGEHLADGCECPGCLPCAHSHCRICTLAHSAGTCPECMAEVRESLHEIGRMCDALPEEVEHRGVDGEAMMLLGPAADPEARGHLLASIRVGRVPADYLEEADGELHPLFVLGTWDMLVRDVLEHDEGDEALTVASAIDYLDRQLTYLGGFEDLPFEDMARDLRACGNHMERVLHDGEQIETGAPCLSCENVRLVRTRTLGEDRWSCPRCKRESNDDQYRFAVKAEFIERSPELNIDDMAARIKVASSTIRRWSHVLRTQAKGEDPIEHPPLLKPAGVVNGRKVYRVEDAEAIRDAGGDQRRRAARQLAEPA